MNIPLLGRLQALARPAAVSADGEVRRRAAATVEAVRAALPELLAAAVVDLRTGQALAVYTGESGLAVAKAAPHYAELVRQKQRAVVALALGAEEIDDILIALTQQLHLLRLSAGHRQFLYLAVDSRDTNLALARSVLQAHS